MTVKFPVIINVCKNNLTYRGFDGLHWIEPETLQAMQKQMKYFTDECRTTLDKPDGFPR